MHSPNVLLCFKFKKMNRRLHLSKTKHSKFNESGQLAAFYLFSFVWGCSILTAVRGFGRHHRREPRGMIRYAVFMLSCLFSSFSVGGVRHQSHFLVGRLPTHPHGVRKDSRQIPRALFVFSHTNKIIEKYIYLHTHEHTLKSPAPHQPTPTKSHKVKVSTTKLKNEQAQVIPKPQIYIISVVKELKIQRI